MGKCKHCQTRPGSKSSVINGVYYPDLCLVCYELLNQGQSVSSGQATYNRGRDAEDHQADLVQPFSGGRASREFIMLYPEQAKRMMTPEEIAQATRSN